MPQHMEELLNRLKLIRATIMRLHDNSEHQRLCLAGFTDENLDQIPNMLKALQSLPETSIDAVVKETLKED